MFMVFSFLPDMDNTSKTRVKLIYETFILDKEYLNFYRLKLNKNQKKVILKNLLILIYILKKW